MRRWRLTSAATVDASAEQRSADWALRRGNATGLGGWTFVIWISLTTLQATGRGLFNLAGSSAALATHLTLAAAIDAVGIGLQRGTHANWQVVNNDGTDTPTLTDRGRASRHLGWQCADPTHRHRRQRRIHLGPGGQ